MTCDLIVIFFLWFFVCPAQTIISIHLQITHCWYGNTISLPVSRKCFCLCGHENDGCWGKRLKPACRLFQVSGALLSHVWQSGHLFLHCCLLHTLVSVRQTAWYTPLTWVIHGDLTWPNLDFHLYSGWTCVNWAPSQHTCAGLCGSWLLLEPFMSSTTMKSEFMSQWARQVFFTLHSFLHFIEKAKKEKSQ